MRIPLLLLITVTLTASAFTAITVINWQIKDDTYSVKFDTKGASGIFKGLKGTIDFDETDLQHSNFNVAIDVNTINTGNGMKNRHAKGEGFFDAEKYPTIQFQSLKIEKTATAFLTTGNLRIKNITKKITFPFTFENKNSEGVFRGNFEVNRNDFNLNRKGVGDNIKIELVVPVKKS